MTERVYLNNPYLRQLDARIVEKIYKDDKYYIKTNRTIFYPNLAGGQPGDKGTISGVKVLDTYNDNEDIVHVVQDNIQSDKVLLSIDWYNRFDYMQQHSGQHLLSAVFYKLFNGETVGFYIGKEYVYIDVNLPTINDEEIIKIEEFANKIIFSNFPMKSYIIEKSELNKLPNIKNSVTNSKIRIVEIDGIDFSPCCGTHLRHTGEIGLIKIRKVENYKGNIRVEFVCGNRALKDYTWKNNHIKNIANLLSSKDKDVQDKVFKLYNQKEELEKENRKLKEELYMYKGDKLLDNAKNVNGINFIYSKFEDLEFNEINNIASYLMGLNKNVILFGIYNKEYSQFLIGKSSEIDINMKNIFKNISENLDIKGGGSNKVVQGKCEKNNLDLVLKSFYENIIGEIQS